MISKPVKEEQKQTPALVEKERVQKAEEMKDNKPAEEQKTKPEIASKPTNAIRTTNQRLNVAKVEKKPAQNVFAKPAFKMPNSNAKKFVAAPKPGKPVPKFVNPPAEKSVEKTKEKSVEDLKPIANEEKKATKKVNTMPPQKSPKPKATDTSLPSGPKLVEH